MKRPTMHIVFGMIFATALMGCGKNNSGGGSSGSSKKEDSKEKIGITNTGTQGFSDLQKAFSTKSESSGVKENYDVVHSFTTSNPVTSGNNIFNSILGFLNVNTVSNHYLTTNVENVDGKNITISEKLDDEQAANGSYDKNEKFYDEVFVDYDATYGTKVSAATLTLIGGTKKKAYVIQHFGQNHIAEYIVSPELPLVANPILRSNAENEIPYLSLVRVDGKQILSITGSRFVFAGMDWNTGKPNFQSVQF